ncbi:hypothetical protein DRQ53_16050 [bacterium]|nr:MAG: hypothetical protein DRQ53_16050 [bacterium]
MKIKLIAVGLTILGLIGLPFISVLASEADQDIGLALRPAIIDLPVEPGTTVSASINIQNISDSAVGVEIGAQSLIPNDPYIDQEKRKETDASTWIINKGKKILLDKNEQRAVDVQFLVPEAAGPGGHYALVTFMTTSVQQQSDPGSIVTPTLSSLAMLNVAGEIHEEASIENLNMPFFVFGDDQTLDFGIANTGNIHLLPTATVKLYDRHNDLVESIEIPAQLILPNTIKSFTANWSSSEHIGIYHLEVDVNYGTPLQTVSLNSGTILIMPSFSSILFALSLIVVVALLFFLVLRKPLKRIFRKRGHTSHKFSLRRKKRVHYSNKPEDLARLSMSSGRIDELLSRNKRRATHPPQKKAKERKIIIR